MSTLDEAERRRRREQLQAARREVWRVAALKAAITRFAGSGYHETAMSDIAAESGVSLSALYKVYPGKDELFVAVLDQAFAEILPVFPEPDHVDPREQVMTVIADLFAFMADNHDLCLLYARANQTGVRLADGRDPFPAYVGAMQERLLRLIEAADPGGVRADVLAHSILATVSAVVVAELSADPDAALHGLVPAVLALYAPHFRP